MKIINPVIELKDVWKIYDLGKTKVEALRGLTMDVKQEEFLAIMGPSGSGKSTAMNMVGCLDVPTSGTIHLDGKNIAHMDESELAVIRGRKIGFVFQMFNLIPTLTALENVMLPMMFQGVPKEKREKRAMELLEMTKIGQRANHHPAELSGGEQQRVAIARALANDPEIVLADEPTGNLDSKTGKEIMEMFVHLHKEHKKTIIIITHDAYIASYAKRKVVLVDGRTSHDHKFAKRFVTR